LSFNNSSGSVAAMTTQRVALLGTGIMGHGMARNIVEAGIPLTVWNRTRTKAEDIGADVADSPHEAVDGADIMITVLADASAVEATVREAAPVRGTIWLQQATVGVQGCTRLAALADELGLVYVDAPVLGTRGPAEAGSAHRARLRP
jgi:3-hydroxyisobutyrate dehydrogenase